MIPYNFTLGNLYRRRDIYRMIGISEETKGGNWDTGYARYDQDWFIFANIGVPGRTGHDYANAWIGANLLWYGKTSATLHQPAIQSMLVCTGRVYIFVRSDQSAPFVFVGCGTPHAVKDTTPVTVLWSLAEPAQVPLAARTLAQVVSESVCDSGYIVEREIAEPFDESGLRDARKLVVRATLQRQGQQGFRYTLLSAYAGRCCVSDTNVPEVLEAAHIIPYRDLQNNQPANGLLLRADIHTLFDLGHIAVDTSAMDVVVSPQMRDSEYGELAGRRLVVPHERLLRPNVGALDRHRVWAGL